MSLFDGPVQPNARVTIQTYTLSEDAAGGPVKTWANVATGVKCLVSLMSGSRPETFGGSEFNKHAGSLVGEDSRIARQDTRFLVESGTGQASFLVGKYLVVTGTNRHPASDDNDIPEAYRATWEQWAGGANT